MLEHMLPAALKRVSSRPRIGHALERVPNVRDARYWAMVEQRVNLRSLHSRSGFGEQRREGFDDTIVVLARRRLNVRATETIGYVLRLRFADDAQVSQVALVSDEYDGHRTAC